jgi:DNA-binding Lrp family transcriptional regulator
MEEKQINNHVTAWEKGEASEEKVFQALEELKEEGIIKNCGRSFRYSNEDSEGKDLLVVTIDEKVIWLQVKSSFNSASKERYLKRGILYIAVGKKSLSKIKEEILEILKKTRNQKRRPKIETKVEISI